MRLRKRATLVKGEHIVQADKATQSAPMERKEEKEEEVAKEKKGEVKDVKAEEGVVDAKNSNQALPRRRSARAARRAIVKAEQVKLSDPFSILFSPFFDRWFFMTLFPLLIFFFFDQVEVGVKGKQHLRVFRGLRGSEELQIGEEDSDDGGETWYLLPDRLEMRRYGHTAVSTECIKGGTDLTQWLGLLPFDGRTFGHV